MMSGGAMGVRGAGPGGMGISPQQMAAMQSQLSAMGMGGMLGALSTSQAIALALIPLSIVMLAVLARRGAAPAAAPAARRTRAGTRAK